MVRSRGRLRKRLGLDVDAELLKCENGGGSSHLWLPFNKILLDELAVTNTLIVKLV